VVESGGWLISPPAVEKKAVLVTLYAYIVMNIKTLGYVGLLDMTFPSLKQPLDARFYLSFFTL
jgi:hypothetical protein